MAEPAAPFGPPDEQRAAFLLLLDSPTVAGMAESYANLARQLEVECRDALGFQPWVRWTALPAPGQRYGRATAMEPSEAMAANAIAELVREGVTTLFLLPISFDFGLQQKEWLTGMRRGLLRQYPKLAVHYDAMQVTHPLLLQAFVDAACRELQQMSIRSPGELGVLLVAGGGGDAETRAESYRLMRLIWEQLAANRADVAFVRHPLLPLPEQLSACARSGLTWLCLPQFFWHEEQFEYARVIFDDCIAQFGARGFAMSQPIARHRNVGAWVRQRIVDLYRTDQQRRSARIRSVKQAPGFVSHVYGPLASVALDDWDERAADTRFGPVLVARVGPAEDMARLLDGIGANTGRVLIKPTWHGYATGTYTDAVALDALLAALTEPAVVVEAHTASKNSAGSNFDWEHDAEQHRCWIRHQEQEYLEKTGLKRTLLRHGASYLNVTECWWDGQCAAPAEVQAALEQQQVRLRFMELSNYVPKALFERRGSVMLSYARFKGPTRLSLSNLFGLLPQPLRSAWHGPNITYFAQVCCDLAKLYGTLFKLYAVIESLNYAVRWERRGLYRSRWGNYDLVESPRVVCLSQGLPAADIIAARLQGQDVTRSAFFDVVRAELGANPPLERMPLPAELLQYFR